MQWKQYMKMAAQHVFLPAIYRLSSAGGIRPGLVVFADAHHNSRPANMEDLYQYLKKDPHLTIREIYLDYQASSFRNVLGAMIRFMRLYAVAEAVVICDNFLPAAGCRKRRGTKVVQLWHACGALKRFGYDTTDDIPAGYRGNVFQNTDLVTVSAPFCVKPFASAMRLPRKNVRPIGICRTDRYFDEAWRESCRQRFEELYPEAKGRRVVVWAPTFRGHPGEPSCVRLDLERLRRALGEEYLVIAKLHPHMKNAQMTAAEKPCPMTTEELFPVTDVLIADYSSLIYEYLLFDRPLVLYTPDYDDYCRDRGFYMKYEEIPGRQIRTEKALPGAVRSAVRDDARQSEKRQAFLQTYMCACDGHSTERVAAWITGGKG